MNFLDEMLTNKTIIFKNMSSSETEAALKFLQAYEKEFKKGTVILSAGDVTDEMGLVLDGRIIVESNDVWGNRSILNIIDTGQFFGEVYALLENTPMLVDVVADKNCRILFMKIGLLNRDFLPARQWAFKLLQNLLKIAVNKNLHLSCRSFHTSSKSIRGRVISYLNTFSIKKKSKEFDVPFNRQQMADYLNLDRSALSNELSKMRKEGIINFHKNHFVLCTSK